jgi:hypothetical protein
VPQIQGSLKHDAARAAKRSDKTVAGFRAREVPGSFSVENELVIEKAGTR